MCTPEAPGRRRFAQRYEGERLRNEPISRSEGGLPVQEQRLSGEAGDGWGSDFRLELLIVERQAGACVHVPKQAENYERVVRNGYCERIARVPAVALELV